MSVESEAGYGKSPDEASRPTWVAPFRPDYEPIAGDCLYRYLQALAV
jgi:hypothetical protein